jgi:hypothetical protein
MTYKDLHTVPRAYLAGFVDPDTPAGMEPYIWVYDRGAETPFRQAPKKLALRSHYYVFTDRTGDRNIAAEELLGRVEGVGLPVLRALDGGCEPSSLSERERGNFAFFVGLLAVRVPRYREAIERMTGDIAKDVLQMSAAHPEHYARTMRDAHRSKGLEPPADIEALRRFALAGAYRVRANPLLSLQVMVETAPRIAYYAFRCQWRVLEAPDHAAFITSDGPLVQVTTAEIPAWYGVGWETPWMEATLPLTPRTCLLLSAHRPEGREIASAARVREINARTAAHAYGQMYSSRPLYTGDLDRPAGQRGWTPASDALSEPVGRGTVGTVQ